MLSKPKRRKWAFYFLGKALDKPEGFYCNVLRRIGMFWDFSVGQMPQEYVRPGETVVFTGMWNTKTLDRWYQQLNTNNCHGKLIIIEGDPKHAQGLKQHISENSMNNVEVVNKVLWSSKTTVTFARKKNGDANYVKESKTYSVKRDLEENEFCLDELKSETDTLESILDELNISHFDHLHMTIGASEAEALEGLGHFFQNKNFRVYVKSILYYQKDNSPVYENVLSIFKRNRMKYVFLNKGNKKPGKRIYAYF